MSANHIPRFVFAAASLLAIACGGTGASVPAGQPSSGSRVAAFCSHDLNIQDPEACRSVSDLLLPEALPVAPGNAVAESSAAAQLGFQIFFDPRFSSIPGVRCATCHIPEKSFADQLPVSQGKDLKPLARNSPSIYTAAWYSSFFWDGRADTLWSQPLFPFENPAEMGTTRLALAHTVVEQPLYSPLYEAVFGARPDLSDRTRFPDQGKPGDPSFDSMASADQDVINRVVANVGKSLEAYMRKVATGRSALDQYLLGDSSSFEPAAQAGLSVFVKAKCIDCHGGPTLSDGLYHDMKVPSLPGAAEDLGRESGLAILAANPFNAQGPYYDDIGSPPPAPSMPADGAEGAFRTPSLRDVALTAPYGHNGYYPTLEALLADHGSTKLTDDETSSIIVFLLQLTGKYPDRPWGNWPTN